MLLISSAPAPCPFANSKTFCPASSALIAFPVPLVDRDTISRIARTIVEIVQ